MQATEDVENQKVMDAFFNDPKAIQVNEDYCGESCFIEDM